MSRPTHLHPEDIHGIARLAADATSAVTDIVEAMHEAVTWPPFLPSFKPSGRAGGISGLVYSGVRGAADLVGNGLDLALTPLVPWFGDRISTPERDATLSVLNGVLGDHLAESGNPLALSMELRRGGKRVIPERHALATALVRRSSRVVVLIHGLCGTDAQWKRASYDYGMALQRDFDFTPLYLRYNSGLHISTNGRSLSGLLDDLVREWPGQLEELMLVGHSMGGLVARSAFEHATSAGHRWTTHVRRMAFLGSPHHGAPLERGGLWFQEELLGSSRYAAPFSRLGRLRSAGITDLRHGNLLDQDWAGVDRFAHAHDVRRPVPLPQGVDCLAVAATTGERRGDVRDRLVADGLVPVASALGHHSEPERELNLSDERRHIVYRMHHMGLLGSAEVYEYLSRWLIS